MNSRNIGVGLAVLVGSLLLAVGTASAHGTAPTTGTTETCVVNSLKKFVLQGEFTVFATVGDIVEVECDPKVYGTGSKIKLTASQLFTRCKNKLLWIEPNPLRVEGGRGISVELDADGNATVALLGGAGCMAGENLIVAHMEEEPFESFTTAFTVEPPEPTKQGLYAEPATQVEDALSSGVATIVEAEFTGGSEKFVHIGSEELFHRCRLGPHLIWVRQNGEFVTGSEITKVQLDNDGNAFVIALGAESCAPGTSLIEGDLESKPFTTLTANFTIEAPRPTI